MSSWIWMFIGIGFLALEMFIPAGFFSFFFGCAALVVGLLTLGGLVTSQNLQMVAFAVFAVALPLVFRAKIRKIFPKRADAGGHDTIGKSVTISETILPGAIGAGELWGTSWRIRNSDTEALHQGDKAVVVSAAGVTLTVKR